MALGTANSRVTVLVVGALTAAAVALYWAWPAGNGSKAGLGAATPANAQAADTAKTTHNPGTLDLSDSQLNAVKVEPVEEREFPVEKEAIGSIDFDEDMTVQVFTPYQGRIIALFAEVGDDVKNGQTLFTIDSPDLLQAESTLIAAAGVLQLTDRESGASARTLQNASGIAGRSGAGDFRPADCGRQPGRGARRGAAFRQNRCRYRQNHQPTKGRFDPRRAEPDQRADYSAQRGARSVGAARRCACSVYRCQHRHHVDAGECRRD